MAESQKYITADELATHTTSGDLWISIHGKIYDVSRWIKSHPGGDLPLRNLAGRDATDAFLAYHPTRAWPHLAQFHNGLHLQNYTVSEVSKDYRKLLHDFTKIGLFENKGHNVFPSPSSLSHSHIHTNYTGNKQ
ncbi:delta(8)-fatty-acid desaturase-like [Salvia miltiorrhiza]|uniref:delta(8)-fatty-acid desaturase-like n=1 Tax=Salvia miltiorrhiza TaxID=226208 RepID=UPI0025AD646E|nr:delta(8)-fatty-acid desaturase-like [Salvia miltiorrhiza]